MKMYSFSCSISLFLFAAMLFGAGCASEDSIGERRRRAQQGFRASESDATDDRLVEEEDGDLDTSDSDSDSEDDLSDEAFRAEDELTYDDEPRRMTRGRVGGDVLTDLRAKMSILREEALYYEERGDVVFEQGRFREAAGLYQEALDRDPTLEGARARRHQCLVNLGERSGEIGVVSEDLLRKKRAGEEQAQIEIKRNLELGRKALEEGDVDHAETLVARAVDMIELNRDYSPKDREEAVMLLETIRGARVELEEKRRIELFEKSQRVKSAEVARDAVRRKEKVQRLLRKTRDLMRLKQYQSAIDTCDAILELEPNNRIAQFWRDDAKDQVLKHRRLKLIHDRIRNHELLDENFAETAVPYNEVFVFPDEKKWSEARKRSESLQFDTFEEPEPVRQIKAILETQQVSFSFEEAPLSEVVATLREALGINIHIDAQVEAGDIPISIEVQQLPASNFLNLLLDRAGLGFTFRENILWITPKESAGGDVTFRIYNVQDVLNKIRDFAGPELLLRDPSDASDTGEAISFTQDVEDTEAELDPDILEELIKESTGGEDEWGDSNTYEYHNGNLLINATPEIHRGIALVLDNLRKDADLFVVVESRFIDIQDEFLEDIGIDYRALGVDSNWGTPFGGVINETATGGNDLGFVESGNPITDVELIMGQDRWAGRVQHIIDGFTGSFRRNGNLNAGGGVGGLTVQGTWLDPFQLNAILRAVQERADIRQLTAPVITAANGQRVYVSVITQRAYIADYELVSGGTGFAIIEVADPVVQTFQEGVILDVEPVISHDKKYVTLDVRPTLATLIGGVISTINISLGSFTNVAFQVPIGIPEISLQQAFTSVTVPNGGTVLLGGFKSLDEGRWKAYLPLLGDIPLIGNLFRRKATVSEKRSLVILLSARIVDLRQSEKLQFNETD